MKTSPMILADSLVKEYGGVRALGPVSFTLQRGGCLAVLGPNGAGKSTMLKLLSTLQAPSAGTLYIDGMNAAEHGRHIRQKIGYISHHRMVYAHLSAQENLMFFARLYDASQASEDRCMQLLETVGLYHRAHDLVGGFSRGMLQRLSIARALVTQAELLLLDEPYSALDLAARISLRELLETLRGKVSMVMVTHHLDEVETLMTDALLLSSGKAVFSSAQAQDERESVLEHYYLLMGGKR